MGNHSLKSFLAGCAATALLCALGTSALAEARQLRADFTGIRVTLDGRELELRDQKGDPVEPFAVEDTTYLPVRAVAEALGLGVDWDAEGNTVALTTGAAPSGETPDGGGREHPVPVGTACAFDYRTGDKTYRLSMTVGEVLRGDAAWALLEKANQFNDPAPEGKEYILAKVSALVLTAPGSGAVTLNAAGFDVFSADGAEYTDYWSAVLPKPRFDARVYEGGKLEGYVAFLVDRDDDSPLAVFGADYKGEGGAWFCLAE